MKTTTQIYTDVGQLGIDSMISKLPSLSTATNTATTEAKNATNTATSEAQKVIEKLAQMLGVTGVYESKNMVPEVGLEPT